MFMLLIDSRESSCGCGGLGAGSFFFPVSVGSAGMLFGEY